MYSCSGGVVKSFLFGLAATAAMMSGAVANAAVITVSPSTSNVTEGGQFTVDLAISDLGDAAAPSVSIYDLDISFDETVIGVADVAFGDQLDLFGLGGLQLFDDSVAGTLNIFELSFDLAADLDDLQLSSFVLATITFDALMEGNSSLGLTIISLGDSLGNALSANAVSSSIMVDSDIAPIPLPGALPLLVTGLFGLGLFRRKSDASQHSGTA